MGAKSVSEIDYRAFLNRAGVGIDPLESIRVWMEGNKRYVSAHVTISDGSRAVSLEFSFDPEGEGTEQADNVIAKARKLAAAFKRMANGLEAAREEFCQ